MTKRRSRQLSAFRLAFDAQRRVLLALMRREVVAKYGRQNIGFLWLMVEPMILTVGVMVLWTILGRGKGDLPLIPFVLTGYAMLSLWRHVTNSSVHFVQHGAPLLFHRQVTTFDLFLTRTFLEVLGSTGAMVSLYTIVRLAGLAPPIEDVSLVVVGWVLMAWFAFGVAGLIGGLTEYAEAAEKFIQPMQYLVLPISGCFFLVDWLMPAQRDIVLSVPLVHMFEIVRAGYFGDRVTTHYDVGYVILSCLVVNAAGLWAVHRAPHYARVAV